jgi:predicted permease
MRSALSQAWKAWKAAPGVALLAVVAFAVGIGSTTAIFTVINGVILRPLPYPEGERYVALYGARTNEPTTFMSSSVQDLQDYQQQMTSFDVFGWFQAGGYNLTSPGEPQYVPGAAVTPSLARQLGAPLLGRWFDTASADDSSVVIASSLWRRLGGRPDIIGTAITLDGQSYTVIGVMPPGFRMPVAGTAMTRGETELWIPLDPSPSNPNPGSGIYFAYGRRKPGVSLEQVTADAKRVAVNIAARDPERHPFYTAVVHGLRETPLNNIRPTLLALLTGAGLLLLIACANVATLLLARSVARARETAIRIALGARRRQLALRYVAEGALVSVAGAAAGVVLSAIFVRQILAAASDFVPQTDDIGIDWMVLAFSAAVALVTGVLAGLAPLWQAARTPPNAVLTEGVRASAAAPVRRLSQAFVITEIALAFTLLAVSAILVVHLQNLGRVTLGFDTDGLLTFDLTLPRPPAAPAPPADATRAERRHLGHQRTAARVAEQQRLIDALQQTPGITGAAYANQLPAYPGCLGTTVHVNGRPLDTTGQRVCLVVASPDYLRTMGIPLRAGRFVTAADIEPEIDEDPVPVVINETAARDYWPNRDPLGESGMLSGKNGEVFQVVGVVGDVRNNGLNAPVEPEVYVSAAAMLPNPMNMVVRSQLPPDQLIAAARRAIRQTDPTLPMRDVAMMNDVLRDTLQLERLSSVVMTFFGLAALFMATLGIYGVVSYFVRQRTVEMGTRMALGAISRDLLTLVLGGGLKLSAAGVALGALALVGAVMLLRRFLQVGEVGWLPFGASTAVVALISAAAASVPAWRATLLSPMVAIREQPPSVWLWARLRVQRAVRDIQQRVAGQEADADVSAADLLTAFVDAARSADSYTAALRAVLDSVCAEMRIDSAALLKRDTDSPAAYSCLVSTGALDAGSSEGTALVVPADGFLITRLQAHPLPLPFAWNELPALAEWAAAHRPERLGEIRALAAADVRLAVPLRTRDEILGVLLFGPRSHRPGYSAHEKQVLRACADQFALMIENARLTGRVVEQETLRRDIALASEVQQRLLPDAAPHDNEIADFAAVSIPARRIGGDYYDFLELRDRALGIALADVSGKGVAAALIMSVVQASLRIISSETGIGLPELVTRMNRFVFRSTPSSKYATFFYAQLDEHRRRLRYINAGHNAPFLLRAAGRPAGDSSASDVEQLSVGGTVVGMFPEMAYEEGTVELCAGDVLLIFTDGVPEAHSPDEEEFGEDRLMQLLRDTAHLTADGISARISAEMKNWIRDAEQYDDLTFIVMKVR